MAYPARIEFPGALYHVMNRGNAGSDIVRDDQDRERFLALLGRTTGGYGWLCHSYCLMDNHYHLLLETPAGNLGAGMQWLSSGYTKKFNWRHGRYGHVFQGRYKAILVDKDAYLLALARYIALNPVRAGLVGEPGAWRWSSYRATAGLGPGPDWLETSWLLTQFGAQRQKARAGFATFVAEGPPESRDIESEQRGGILGGDAFRAGLADLLRSAGSGGWKSGAGPRMSLSALAGSGLARDDWMARAHRDEGYKLREIAAFTRLDVSTVSRAVRSGKARAQR